MREVGRPVHRPFLALLVLGLLEALWYYLGERAGLIFATLGKGDPPVSANAGCSVGYPCFNPLVYSFQLLIPGLDLREATYWWPDTSKHPWGTPAHDLYLGDDRPRLGAGHRGRRGHHSAVPWR